MALLILSFVAGALTVAAPCILPLLPVVLGGSLVETAKDRAAQQWLRPIIIAGGLAVSVTLFTLLIKTTTALLDVPVIVWQAISGFIVVMLGLQFLWPAAWETISAKAGLAHRANALFGKAFQRKGYLNALLIGAALGPVFSSCSPTYALIVATVLPVSFAQGLLYLLAYAIGMSLMLLLIAYLGQAFIAKTKWLSNPSGWFKRIIGVVFIVVGISVAIGLDKKLQAFVLEQGWYDPISTLEKNLSR